MSKERRVAKAAAALLRELDLGPAHIDQIYFSAESESGAPDHTWSVFKGLLVYMKGLNK
mgnify:CR=1 FL=1